MYRREVGQTLKSYCLYNYKAKVGELDEVGVMLWLFRLSGQLVVVDEFGLASLSSRLYDCNTEVDKLDESRGSNLLSSLYKQNAGVKKVDNTGIDLWPFRLDDYKAEVWKLDDVD